MSRRSGSALTCFLARRFSRSWSKWGSWSKGTALSEGPCTAMTPDLGKGVLPSVFECTIIACCTVHIPIMTAAGASVVEPNFFRDLVARIERQIRLHNL